VTETFEEVLRRAIGNPGSITPRLNDEESTTRWSARAVGEILRITHGVDPHGHFPHTPATEALLENASLRGALHQAARLAAVQRTAARRAAVQRTLLHEAWGLIANAENTKHSLTCEHPHCSGGEHQHPNLLTEPIGPADWREAMAAWRDRWHAAELDRSRPAIPAEPTERPKHYPVDPYTCACNWKLDGFTAPEFALDKLKIKHIDRANEEAARLTPSPLEPTHG
jgi:hypothetical protein